MSPLQRVLMAVTKPPSVVDSTPSRAGVADRLAEGTGGHGHQQRHPDENSE
ncbi:hypothetical protein K7W42_22040 [Deinococcus sp. HMF7604]|uniref:hypothetical protein n=1 Tax=Deinococcus betulae TaxID=2873312 RepID=UPI001CCCB17C|nr:hypothetical protein [Deinococcus betulae]MBZ9753516.1 hypothetical protein [Deinococcus betulae]